LPPKRFSGDVWWLNGDAVNPDHLILLVEDREEDALLFVDALKRAGLAHPLFLVSDGLEAMNYLSGRILYADRRKFPIPKILMLDLNLPRINGWDVLRWVRAQPELNNMLVVVITSSTRPSDLSLAYQMGANSFLTKPCSVTDLKNLAKAFPKYWRYVQEPQPSPSVGGGPGSPEEDLRSGGITPPAGTVVNLCRDGVLHGISSLK
jgi:CheY-like chemotaxis protein